MKPIKTFAEMKEVFKQHAQGLITDGEAILAMQCTPLQTQALIAMHRLPMKAFFKIDIADMEPDWEREVALAEHEKSKAV